VEHLAALALLIGLADSANPSTIAPGLYFATGAGAVRALAGFIAGVFFTNLAAGVAIALGPGRFLTRVVSKPSPHLLHLIELAAGLALLVLAAILWRTRRRLGAHVTRVSARLDRSALVVGAGLMLVELPTALPYFAVIAAVADSSEPALHQVLVLAIFNAAFVLPLLLILGFRAVAGRRAAAWLEGLRAKLDRWIATLVPVLVLVLAIALIAAGAYGLVKG
jgi:cytochrome c biogenesis protein CcdA